MVQPKREKDISTEPPKQAQQLMADSCPSGLRFRAGTREMLNGQNQENETPKEVPDIPDGESGTSREAGKGGEIQ